MAEPAGTLVGPSLAEPAGFLVEPSLAERTGSLVGLSLAERADTLPGPRDTELPPGQGCQEGVLPLLDALAIWYISK